MKLHGRVVRAPFAKGSKSEHEAVYLQTDKARYVLRRKGGNAFHDPELDKLVGKTVVVDGVLSGTTLLATGWVVQSGGD